MTFFTDQLSVDGVGIAIYTKKMSPNAHSACKESVTVDIITSPTVSIAIATRNAGNVLQRCLDSLVTVAGHVEVIIKDCLSTDNTASVANAYRMRFPLFRFISVTDSGISDAWNQAVTLEGPPLGEWVLFLGADDFLYMPERFIGLLSELSSLPEKVEYAASTVTLVNKAGFAVDTLHPSRKPARDLPHGMPLPHQGLFHRRRLFREHAFNPALRITGDYEFLCRTLRPDNLAYLDLLPAVCMSLGGASGSLNAMAERNSEALSIARTQLPGASHFISLKRLWLSRCFQCLAFFMGEKRAEICADTYRTFRGKTRIWKSSGMPQLPPSLCLAPFQRTMPLSESLDFSLLIATVNRINPLRQLLESLCAQTVRSFEVLIADQNPEGFLQPLMDEFQSRLRVQVLRVPNEGVSQARNTLLPHAVGRFIAFPDDDCYYEPEALDRAVAAFDMSLHIHALVGRWSDPKESTCKQADSFRLLNWYSVFKRGGTHVQFYRKEVVDSIGEFDERFGPGTDLPYGCGEDTDYLLRTVKAAFIVAYAPTIHIRHKAVSAESLPEPQKIRSYAFGRMGLLRKHKLPFWFQLATILYPLTRLAPEGRKTVHYRLAMFKERLGAFMALRKVSL